jgi:hypothetical protein
MVNTLLGEICVTLRNRVEAKFGSEYREPWRPHVRGNRVILWTTLRRDL